MAVKKTLRAVDKPFFNFAQALYLSFYSARFYVDVAKRWRGFGWLYILFVIAILNIPVALRMMYNFHNYFQEQIVATISALPNITIQNGEIKVEYKKPLFIYDKAHQVTAIIDPENTINISTKLYPELILLVQKNRLVFNTPVLHKFLHLTFPVQERTPFIQEFSYNTNEVFVGKEWLSQQGIGVIYWLGMLLIYPTMVLFIFGFLGTLLLLFTFLGQFFAKIIFKTDLNLRQSSRLLLIASTPALILFFIILSAGIIFTGIGFIYIILIALYFSYAIIVVKQEDKKLVLN